MVKQSDSMSAAALTSNVVVFTVAIFFASSSTNASASAPVTKYSALIYPSTLPDSILYQSSTRSKIVAAQPS